MPIFPGYYASVLWGLYGSLSLNYISQVTKGSLSCLLASLANLKNYHILKIGRTHHPDTLLNGYFNEKLHIFSDK